MKRGVVSPSLLGLLVVASCLVRPGLGLVPGVCPNLQTNICYFNSVAKLQPEASTYYAVGGLFDIHQRGYSAYTCGSEFNHRGVMLSQAFLWALSWWQSQLSSNMVSVGGVVFDSCGREDQMIQNVLGFEQCNLRIQDIDRHNLVGFVGTSNSDAEAAASLTADMDLTLISPMANSVLLSDHQQYPYFLRTVPSLDQDVLVLADLLDHVGTRYVAAVYQESEAATMHDFEKTMEQRGICITSSTAMTGEELDDAIMDFVDTTLPGLRTTRFIALFLTPDFALRFMTQVSADEQARNLNLVFLMTSSIPIDSPLFDGAHATAASDALLLQQQQPMGMELAVNTFLQNWETLIQQRGLPANNRIDNPFLSTYLNQTPAAQVPRDDRSLANTIMAARAFVEGVQQAGFDICSNNDNYLCSQFFNEESRGSNINQKIRGRTHYFTPMGPDGKFLDGDLRPGIVNYTIHAYQPNGNFMTVGTFSENGIDFDNRLDTNGAYNPGQCPDPPCLQCGELPSTTTSATIPDTTPSDRCQPLFDGNYSIVYYPPDQEITGAYMDSERADSEYDTRFEIKQRWIIALGVLAGLGILSVIIFEIYILYKLLGTRMGHKWRTMWLGQLLLLGIFLCYLTLFAYLPIPTKATCGITRFGVGVSYSICFAVLLVKLMVILTSKSSESSLLPGDMDSPNYLRGIYQFLMFVFVVGVQVVIDTQWLITVPPEAVKVTSNNGDEVWICNHYTFKASGGVSAMTDMSGFVRNEFENHVLSLVYIMFLILITTVLSLNAHGIITNHRESVFIGIAAGFSIPVWLSWTLVGGLNKDQDYAQEFGDACIAFGLFLTATLILFAMFLPKVRQLVSMGVEGIYFEDDRETVYAGSVIMAPPSYKSRPNSVIYVSQQGIYSEPVVVGNGDTSNYLRHPGTGHPTPASTYSAPPAFLKKGGDSTLRGGGSVLRVTDDLSGRRPVERKRPLSEAGYYATAGRPRSAKGTLPRSRSHTNLGAL